MARKNAKQFKCDNCGQSYLKWQGACDSCGKWNTIEEVIAAATSNIRQTSGSPLKSMAIDTAVEKASEIRYSSGIDQVDDVLGGGVVAGSVILIAGEPGIGKSTLLLQLAHKLAPNQNTLYVSGEESSQQIGLRSKRLDSPSVKLKLATTTSADDIVATIHEKKHKVVIVDSIQTVAYSQLTSNPGSVAQITTCAHLFNEAAKASGTTLILVGHVTKDGAIAGPKVLEHLVDVVLNLEGDRYGGYKVLRSIKNRFGSTNEVALFEMRNSGLLPIANPSQALLAERQVTDGSVVFATLEGSRPLLVEVQALVNPSQFGYPKRTASGFDLNRLTLLVAVLSRRTKLSLHDKDIFINIVGGMTLSDRAADLAVCMAIASAAKGLKLSDDYVVFGEVGLSGEVRHVPMVDKRLKEAKDLGFKGAIAPKSTSTSKQAFVKPVTDVRSALNTFLKS